MTVKTSKSIWCEGPTEDGSGCTFWEWLEEGEPPLQWAKKNGWSRIDDRDLCPGCTAITNERRSR